MYRLPLSPSNGEIAALTGVRGLAILAVLFVHSYQLVTVLLSAETADFIRRFGEAGVFGVDLFFVLSGYLITSILLRRKSEPHYFRNFYARRFLRLFPLYYGFLLVVALIVPVIHRLTLSTAPLYNGSWWWYVLYLSNWKTGNGAQDPFLGHFWSLAVEEQFYLIWPAVVWFLSRRHLAFTCVAIIIGATGLRVYLSFHGVDWLPLYRWTVTRFDVLAFGALTAIILQNGVWKFRAVRWSLAGGVTGTLLFTLLAIYAGTTSWEARPIQLWAPEFAALAFSCLIVYASTNPSGVLTKSWLMRAGKYSYGIYVLHVVVFIYCTGLHSWISRHLSSQFWRLTTGFALLGLEWALVFGAAALSWKYFEEPLLRYKSRFENRPRRPRREVAERELVSAR